MLNPAYIQVMNDFRKFTKIKVFSNNYWKTVDNFNRKISCMRFSTKFKFKHKLKPLKLWKYGDEYKVFYSNAPSNNVVSSPFGEIVVPNLLFHEMVTRNWSLWESKIAVHCASTGKKVKFRDLLAEQKILAASIQNKLKLKKGDCVALVLLNSYEFPLLVLACSMCGVIPSPTNPSQTMDELSNHFADCKVKAIFTNPFAFSKSKTVAASLNLDIPIIVIPNEISAPKPEGAIAFSDLLDPKTSGTYKQPSISMDDTVVLPYSSGTIGIPKGVMLTHKNLVANLAQLSHPESIITTTTTRFSQDKVFGVLPMYHIYGLMVITFNTLKEGSRLIVLPKFDPIMFVKTVIFKKPRILYLVPPLIQFLNNPKIKKKYLKNAELIVNAASPLPEKFAIQLLEKGDHLKIIQGYGMTETSPVLSHTNTNRMQKIMSVGVPVASTKFKIVDPTTHEILPKGKEGELCVKGPQVMKGYFNKPEETKNMFDADGWLRTGDVAYYDEEGDFFIVERLKDLIKVKGYQVAPGEIEHVLRQHPDVKEVAVAGVPDEVSGEVPKAFVVLKPGSKVTEKELIEYVKPKLSSYKHVKSVKFVDELPKNTIGKILRKKLKTMN